MRIVIAGIYRSGSTFLYNVARVAIERAGHEPLSGFEDQYEWHKHSYEYEVIKTHKFYASLARTSDIVLTSWRNIDDIYRSINRIGLNKSRMDHYLRWLLNWQSYSDYMMDYDLIEQGKKLNICSHVVNILELSDEVKPSEVLKEVDSLNPPQQGSDPKTLLHAGHIS